MTAQQYPHKNQQHHVCTGDVLLYTTKLITLFAIFISLLLLCLENNEITTALFGAFNATIELSIGESRYFKLIVELK